ncbi:MAG: hypothetical protein KKA90_03955 [Nanoarchaeota archaeon]|nr:hypothetical protein [Nanoarchaeota archaeon]
MRKGISPIIAAILLVAIAVVLGTLTASWLTNWAGIQINKNDISCSLNTNYLIESAIFNHTNFNDSLQLRIVNKGSQDLYGFGVVLDNTTVIKQIPSASGLINATGLNITNPLKREQTFYLYIYLGNTTFDKGIGATLTEVRVTNDACDAVSQKTKSITSYP